MATESALRCASLAAFVLAASGAVCPSASSAERRVDIRGLSGSGNYSDSLARTEGDPGPAVYASQHFEWAIAPNTRRRVLALPRHGRTKVAVPLQVHLVSNGGGTYVDFVVSPPREVSYTCHADAIYQTRASLLARARRDGWRLTLRSIKELEPGAPECTDEFAQDYFFWGTGGDWFAGESVARQTLAVGQSRGSTVEFTNSPPANDCTEVPGVTPACTENLAWTATLRLKRHR